MLKALELVGFKSFADRTRFEFPSGITVVVGPNGAGKSNVVDAVKWVLGEQKVKSLRGKEMADVIFNGSRTRRAMNSAEITLTLDNSSGLLNIDTPQVHITRRVYRGGEGEYLINRQPCRLRDIRDLLSGTGLGTQAYSVIEQGKVDVLLQASSRDRRVIFEEAAGISRFKTKRLEAQRRLERVEQNLLRLSDIVDEVENRLRSVRLQANKARRYETYANRLQELRTQVGLVDWTRLSERLARFESDLGALSAQRAEASARAETLEVRLLEVETRIGDATEEIRQSEARIAANRERIAAQESAIDHQRAASRDLEAEISRLRQRCSALSARAGDLQEQLQQTNEAFDSAAEHHRQIARLVVEGERELTDLIRRLDQIRQENEQRRAAYVERMRDAAALGNQISGLESQVAAALAARQRNQQRMSDVDRQLDLLAAELDELRRRRTELDRQVDERRRQLTAAKAQLAELEQESASRQRDLAQLQQHRSGAAERTSILEELQRRHEGISPGVREVLAQARNAADGPFRQVRGLVADLLDVGVEAALMVEVALGEKAQHVVVAPGDELLDYLQSQTGRFAGRVGFVWLGEPTGSLVPHDADLERRPGVLGRADRFVKTEPEYAPLAERLLGRTWIVEKLSDALALRQLAARPLNFVTLAGELLAADGTLSVGPRHASTGLISRRSELKALKAQLAELHAKIDLTQGTIHRLDQQIAERRRQVDALAEQHREALDAAAEHAHRITAAEERRLQLSRQRSLLETELTAVCQQHDSASQVLAGARAKQREIQSGLTETEGELARLGHEIDRLEAERRARDRRTTESKVELAKSEERLGNLRARMRQVEESRRERHRAIAESREQLIESARKADQSRWNVLEAESEVAELYLRKEAYAAQTLELINQRDALRGQRSELTEEVRQIRRAIHDLEEKTHAKELAAGEVRHQRNSLADRLREDYGIELAELEHEPTDEEQHQREEVQQEIDGLRRKISNLGNVNLEALEELQQLEARHRTLAGQHKDLTDAKTSLERIIERINADSRRLFADTLQTVRDHFKVLFRDLFGGGQADIVLEEGADILETGIEIVARPPGKEPRSISLLSGGEKTLTCVALLLAIFRSRPSPFCVLDEVDAALDEANIDRFIKVLRDFLAWTQFIIVTHSKKTMTCANTLYGVTMQESGVSKQVSVRFEDVSEDGEILLPPESDAPPPDVLDEDETQAA